MRGLRFSGSIQRAQECIYQRERFRPRTLRHLRHFRDGSDIRRQFDDQRPVGPDLRLGHQVRQQFGIAAEDHPALVHIRAGNIELICRDSVYLVQAIQHRDVIFRAVSKHVRYNGAGGVAAHWRELLLQERLHANVLQPDGVHHA